MSMSWIDEIRNSSKQDILLFTGNDNHTGRIKPMNGGDWSNVGGGGNPTTIAARTNYSSQDMCVPWYGGQKGLYMGKPEIMNGGDGLWVYQAHKDNTDAVHFAHRRSGVVLGKHSWEGLEETMRWAILIEDSRKNAGHVTIRFELREQTKDVTPWQAFENVLGKVDDVAGTISDVAGAVGSTAQSAGEVAELFA